MIQAFFNADDFALSKGANKRILKAHDDGILTGTSILPNGLAFDDAVKEYRSRKNLVLTVHLNLVEGRPLSPPAEVPELLNDKGELNCSFGGLLLKFLLKGEKERQDLRRQIRTEIKTQIERVQSILKKDDRLRLDSHQHLHMLPFVFDEMLVVAKSKDVQYIRVPRERFFLCLNSIACIKNYLGANIIKHLLLNVLSVRAHKLLAEARVSTCDQFVGVLFTGAMTPACAEKALRSLPKGRSEKSVEILFHPGRPDDHEADHWRHRPELFNYYFNPWRERELHALLSPTLRHLADGLNKA